MNLRLLKNTPVSALLVFFYALLPGHVLAATTAVTIAPISGGVINFGSFAVLAGCSNCSITISPAGARSVSGAIVLTSANAGSPATFSVTQTTCPSGNPKCSGFLPQSVTAPAVLPAGGVNMTLSAFTFSPTVPQTGAQGLVTVVSVGATLTIPSRGTAGTFSGGGFTYTTTP